MKTYRLKNPEIALAILVCLCNNDVMKAIEYQDILESVGTVQIGNQVVVLV